MLSYFFKKKDKEKQHLSVYYDVMNCKQIKTSKLHSLTALTVP